MKKSEFKSIPIKVKYSSKDKTPTAEIFNIEWLYLNESLIEKDIKEETKNALVKIGKNLEMLNRTIEQKEYKVTEKLKIIDYEKSDLMIRLVFSNGIIGKIFKKDVKILGINDIESFNINKGDLFDYSSGNSLSAEEIFNKLKKHKMIVL